MNNSPPMSSSYPLHRMPRPQRVDAHHHLWQYSAAEFGWINNDMAVLRRDFLIDDLQRVLRDVNIDATVAIQARESLDETQWLLECANVSPVIHGVVGWAPLETENLQDVLGHLKSANKLVGLREIVQGKADGYLDRLEFNRGLQQLTSLNLTYDILIHEHQLIEATRLVDRHPHQKFVVDHAAKPRISECLLEPWSKNLRELARRQNVFCKISGLVTEASWQSWTLESLRPYLDVCVAAFEPNRLLAGSDWPVCLLASTYSHWWNLLEIYFADFGTNEVQRVFGETAMEFYGISSDVEVSS